MHFFIILKSGRSSCHYLHHCPSLNKRSISEHAAQSSMQLSMQQQAHSTLHSQHLHEMERALPLPVLSLRNTKLLLPTHAGMTPWS